jgi:hypothetical protein
MPMHTLAVRDNHGCCRLSRRRIVLFHKEILAVQGAGQIIIRIDRRTVSCIHRTIAGSSSAPAESISSSGYPTGYQRRKVPKYSSKPEGLCPSYPIANKERGRRAGIAGHRACLWHGACNSSPCNSQRRNTLIRGLLVPSFCGDLHSYGGERT